MNTTSLSQATAQPMPRKVHQADLRHCETEAIHLPEAIQAYGALLVCDAESGRILRHSDNLIDHLQCSQTDCLGLTLTELLGVEPQCWDHWRSRACSPAPALVARVQSSGGAVLELLAHALPAPVDTPHTQTQLIFEIIPDHQPEALVHEDIDLLARLATAMRHLNNRSSLDEFTHQSVTLLQEFLGYDRVMLYRFAPDWSGEVIAEATAPGLGERFLGQRFPASDIPSQARELYTRNLLRVVGDVQANASALVSDPAVATQPLDQSHCLLRQPSPMHLAYLHNMGVRATLTISLLYQGRLWGMLACHHHQPRVPPQNHRRSVLVACELIADTLTTKLDALLSQQTLQRQRELEVLLLQLESSMKFAHGPEAAWEQLGVALRSVLGDVEIYALLHGQPFGYDVFSESAKQDLQRRLQAVRPGTAVATDSLLSWGWIDSDCMTPEPMAGALAVSPNGTPDTYFVVLRPVWQHTVRWGGKPHEFSEVTHEDGQVVLGARRSFEVWLQHITNRCQPWQTHEHSAVCEFAALASRQFAKVLLSEARERNRVLGASLDLLDDMIVVTEAEPVPGQTDRRITYVNPAVCQHTGYDEDELIGQPPRILQGPASDPQCIQAMGVSLAQWQPASATLINYRKDGTPYWVDLKIVPVANSEGGYTHWISVQRDITEQVRLQQRLQSEKDRLLTVMQATGAGTWTHDFISGFITLDEACASMLGYPTEAVGLLTQQNLLDFIHPEDLPQLVNARASHLGGATQFYEAVYRMRHQRGHHIHVRSRGRLVRRDPGGQPALMIGTFVDISESRQLRDQLAHQHKFLDDLTSRLPGVVYQLCRKPQGELSFTFLSRNAADYLGVDAALGMADAQRIWQQVQPEDLPALRASIERSALTRGLWQHQFRLRSVAGASPRILECYATPQSRPHGEVVWHGFFHDVTDQAQMAAGREQAQLDLEATMAALPDPLLTLDRQGQVLMARSREDSLLGCPVDQLPGRSLLSLLDPEARTTLAQALQQSDQQGQVQNVQFSVGASDALCHYECSVAAKRVVGEGSEHGYVLTVRDISERKRAEAQIEQLAYFDPLTGLLNRRALFDRLAQARQADPERANACAVLFVDIDNFKDLNDTLGHHIGDEMLREIARRLRAELGPDALLARLGGDEFVLILLGLPQEPNPRAAADAALAVAEKIRAAMTRRFVLEGMPYQTSCSIGITLGTPAAEALGELMKRADIAMYQAKGAGRNHIHFFDPDLQNALTRRAALEQDLRYAIERGELQSYYQPIVNRQRQICGHEVLLRWHHPERGFVSPADFIPVAEQSGLILPIGQWVLEQACATLAEWARQPARAKWFLAVNISARQVQCDDFVPNLRDVLRRHRANPKRLKLELTESLLHTDINATIEKMRQLGRLGLQFAMDDFGTGYSSMSYLKRLPLQQLKIDRSFVDHLPQDADDAAIATMIHQLAATLGLDVVAEGVETEAQVRYLSQLGCQFFQGYLFGAPGPVPLAQPQPVSASMPVQGLGLSSAASLAANPAATLAATPPVSAPGPQRGPHPVGATLRPLASPPCSTH